MKSKSFTLIELLVVIVIIGILAGVIMISTSSSINKANLAKAQAFSSTVQNELLLNLVSEWTFDEPELSGNTTKDSWGSNHGTVVGATRHNANSGECIFGGCYEFASGNYISIGNIQMANQVSISAWGKTDKTIPQMIFGQTSGTFLYFPVSSNGKVKASFDGASAGNPECVYISDDNWHFIVITNNNSVAKMYIDGILQPNWTETLATTSLFFSIGKYGASSNYLYAGLIDDIRLYSATLSSSQIKQNYIAGLDSLLSSGNISKDDYNQRINALAYE